MKFLKLLHQPSIYIGPLLASALFVVLTCSSGSDVSNNMDDPGQLLRAQPESAAIDLSERLQNALGTVSTGHIPTADEREKYKKRNAYRAQNLIGWT